MADIVNMEKWKNAKLRREMMSAADNQGFATYSEIYGESFYDKPESWKNIFHGDAEE